MIAWLIRREHAEQIWGQRALAAADQELDLDSPDDVP
jgi:hypothetical protein